MVSQKWDAHPANIIAYNTKDFAWAFADSDNKQKLPKEQV